MDACHLLMAALYAAGAALWYAHIGERMREALDEEEMTRGTLRPYELRAFVEFWVLIAAITWFVSIPLILIAKLAKNHR